MLNHLPRRALLAGLAGGLAAPHVARAAVRRIRIGNGNAPDAQFGMGCKALAAAAAADPVLSGVVRIDVYHNESIGDEAALLGGCVNGTVDLALVSSSSLGSVAPQAGLLTLPFLFRDVPRARAALDGAIGEEFTSILRAKSVNVLAWGENGMRHITANRAIRTPADMQGLKIRLPPSDVMLDAFRAFGADPRVLPFGQLREALRTGEVEAQENPIGLIELNKFNEIQKYLVLSGHVYTAALFLASSDLLEDMSDQQQHALHRCARIGAEVTRQVSEAAQRDGVDRLRASGMTVIADVDTAAFIAASKPRHEALGQRFGVALMQRLLAAGA